MTRTGRAPRTLIRFHYDIVSPYSYLGFEQMRRLEAHSRWGRHVDVDYVPVFLGAVMKLAENQPPATNRLKGAWMMNDLRRASRIHAVPMAVLPSVGFPVLTLLAQRLLIAVRRHESKTVYDECVHRLFAAYWAQERDVSDATVLADSLRDSVMLKRGVDEYLELAKTVDVKRELQTCTEQVVGEYGAFGLPWIVVSKGSSSISTGVALAPGGDASARATTTASKDTTTTACFFGSDRFEAIAHFIDHPAVRYESALAQPVVTPTDPETDRSRSKL